MLFVALNLLPPQANTRPRAYWKRGSFWNPIADVELIWSYSVNTMDTPERPSGDGLKRRQSESGLSEQESKRQRVSPGKSSPTAPNDATSDKQDTPTEDAIAQAEPDPRREKRRKSGVADEKQRSKRLFGALLGNLNQPSDRTSKRRQEIESRRKAELQRQDDERLEDKQRRTEQLLQRRKKEQVKVDEHNVWCQSPEVGMVSLMTRRRCEYGIATS